MQCPAPLCHALLKIIATEAGIWLRCTSRRKRGSRHSRRAVRSWQAGCVPHSCCLMASAGPCTACTRSAAQCTHAAGALSGCLSAGGRADRQAGALRLSPEPVGGSCHQLRRAGCCGSPDQGCRRCIRLCAAGAGPVRLMQAPQTKRPVRDRPLLHGHGPMA